MSDRTGAGESGWFAAADTDGSDGDAEAIAAGTTDEPENWPRLAVETGFAETTAAYYDRLHRGTVEATRAAVEDRERADDRQLIHAVRAMDDCRRTANELAERLSEWAGTIDRDPGSGVSYARSVANGETEVDDATVVSLAGRVVDLAEEADRLEATIREQAPTVAPNLSSMAGPVLTARLLSLAGGLESLAKKPSGTLQVLGAEDALFAHLRGHAPSPKHGVIYTHEAVGATRPEDRGSAARALAGKLTIAARVDHYSGELRPELADELADRIRTIRARADDDERADGSETDDGQRRSADE
ncbi:NOP5/NOP56 family protein [Halovivax sp.]|uniref:NOP5/NOP56 family protein n=1 Tax=Halovivax sp. TaxID=1935978 RepID=UPI0025C14134|nr:NOP5/NOP56 family protein [Halovivax sp.]